MKTLCEWGGLARAYRDFPQGATLQGRSRQLDLQAMEAEAVTVTMGAQAARAVWTYEALGFPRAGDYSLVLFR